MNITQRTIKLLANFNQQTHETAFTLENFIKSVSVNTDNFNTFPEFQTETGQLLRDIFKLSKIM